MASYVYLDEQAAEAITEAARATRHPTRKAALTALAGRIAEVFAENESEEATDYRERAKEEWTWARDGDLEIDDDALVSVGEGGAFVLAWVWVHGPDVDEEEE